MSFIHQIHKHSTQLGLVIDKGWRFNEKGVTPPNVDGPTLSKTEVLKKIFSDLQQAQVYYYTYDFGAKLVKQIGQFTKKIDENEKNSVNEIVDKIQELLKQKTRLLWECFCGAQAQEVNRILDKKIEDISEQEYHLMFDLANAFAHRRKELQFFYLKTAIKGRINNLYLHRPKDIKLDIKKNVNDIYLACPIPSDISELQFLLFIQFQFMHNLADNIESIDKTFIKEIIKRRQNSKNSEFISSLDAHLLFLYIKILKLRKAQVEEDREKQLLKLKERKLESHILAPYLKAFFPDDATESSNLTQTTELPNLTQFSEEKDAHAKQFFEDEKAISQDFDRWYTAIYEKIVKYKNFKPNIELPSILPEDYISSKKFISTNDIKIPIQEKIQNWKKQESNKSKKQKNNNTILSEKEILKKESLEEKISVINSDPKISFEEYILNYTVKLADGGNDENIPIFQAVKKLAHKTLNNEPKSLHEIFLEASPFKINERITKWFSSDQDLPIKNNESKLVHDFAWAANEILWRFGLRYSRENEDGRCEPAIAMLCQIEHHLFTKPELFKITVTFSHTLDKDNPIKQFDAWFCYHRTLTRNNQKNEVVEEYMKNGLNRFIDFPELPSKSLSKKLNFEFPESLINKEFPDGSFIEKIEGSIITIRDPKHDSGKNRCRLSLFVVK